MADCRKLYIELLKMSVGNFIYNDDLNLQDGEMLQDPLTGKYRSVDPAVADNWTKYMGGIWPSRAHTMIGMERLNNLQHCVESVLKSKIPGDLIETGVWRGGATILMRGILKAHGIRNRNVWVADSFEGLPPVNLEKYPNESKDEFYIYGDLAVSLEQVKDNFSRYGLLDHQVCFLKGWFKDTLPSAPIKKLAVMRLDGDLYESTMDALIHLYPKLSVGGYVIIDDYNAVESCNLAVHDYRAEHNIKTRMSIIPGAGSYWKKAH